MFYQSVFKRHEIKYMITQAQRQWLLEEMRPYMKMDQYGRTTIRNLYFDTSNFRMIRRSLEKPMYKEKLRLRAYGDAADTGKVFLELKKKYRGVVYKRRTAMEEGCAIDWISGLKEHMPEGQIEREIDYVRSFYRELAPRVFLSYRREAFYCLDGSDFRATFDDSVIFRDYDLALASELRGTDLLPPGMVLMELKTAGAIPLWMAHALNNRKIYKTSFSKYGTAYSEHIVHGLIGGGLYV